MQPRPPLDQRLRPGQRLALDLAAGAGYGFVAWVLFAHKISPWPVAVAGTVLVAVPFAASRTRPFVAFAAGLAGFWAAPVAPALPFLALAPLGYVLYRIADRQRARVALAVLALAMTGPAATAVSGPAGGVIPYTVALVLAWTIGYARGQHRRYDRELVRHHADIADAERERAARAAALAEAERDRATSAAALAEAERERAGRAAAEERIRIARELHDIIAHSLSTITVQAGYGHLVVDRDPDEARAALAAIEGTGRQTLVDMRRLLGVLRDDDPPELAPTPGLADLPRLVAQTGRAGVPVELAVTGPSVALPTAIELATYRIVQEALTNVVKHAGPARARVTVDCRPEDVDIEVTDDGVGAPVTGGGLGLAGMRERALRHGGRLDAGPRPGGGFRVAARLPVPTGELLPAEQQWDPAAPRPAGEPVA